MISKLEQVKRSISARDFGILGLENTAYIKAVTIDGKKLHAIHAADGTPLTIVAEREIAIATVRQHEMQPASVH
jgi:hypothetical protein